MSVDYSKLKTNLSLIMHRLKLVEKKKMELNQKARRTIGEFLNAGKVDRARIRVEQIIREDYVVEAMDLIESYCDFLVSRFGQLQASELVEDGLATPVSSIIWAAPRLENDVPELKVICDQLSRKYGKQYVLAVRDNQLKTVNEILIKKMGMEVPPKLLVEKYLVEIAKDQKIDYKPDPRILKESEANTSATSDEDSLRQQAPSQAPQSGFNLIDLGDHYPRNPITQPFSPYGQPPPLPSEPPLGPQDVSSPFDSSSQSISIFDTTDASAPSVDIPIGFNLNQLNNSVATSSNNPTSSVSSDASQSRKVDKLSSASKQQLQPSDSENVVNSNAPEAPPPNYDSVVNKQNPNQTQYYSFGPESSFAPNQSVTQEDLNDTLPELPPVPKDTSSDALNTSACINANSNSGTTVNSTAANSDDALDFNELTRRFEELKNKN